MTPADPDPLSPLTDEFIARLRRGERPEIVEYAAAHPALADRIRQLFPTLLLLEGLAAAPPDRTTDHVPTEPGFEVTGRTFGPYRLIREIGRGGMGVVFEAEHETLHRRVALKLLTVAGPNAGSRLERFFREAQIAAGLHHTNIVPVFDVGQIGGRAYYAMQFIAGRSLDQVERGERADTPLPASAPPSPTSPSRGEVSAPPPPLRGRSVQPQVEPGGGLPRGRTDYLHIASLGRQAAVGLAYAHQRGVIHRDIKPANLLLDGQGTLWITDFGLARRLDDATLTADGQMLGTPRYMSPEQAAAATSPIDHRTDIYSLGVSLYELLVGRPAHDGQTPPEVVNQILTRDPAPLRAVDPSLPRDLETVVLKAMARRPADRYQTAQELADDLGRFASGEPVKARRIGVLGRTWRWAKREPKVAGLIAAVVLTLLAGVVGTGLFAELARVKANESIAHAENTEELLKNTVCEIASGKIRQYRSWDGLLWYSAALKPDDAGAPDANVVAQALAVGMRYPEWNHGYGQLLKPLSVPSQMALRDDRSLIVFWSGKPGYSLGSGVGIGREATLSFDVDETGTCLCIDHRFLVHRRLHLPRLGHIPYDDVSLYTNVSRDFIYMVPHSETGDNPDDGMRWDFRPFSLSKSSLVPLIQLLACHRLDRGRYVPLSHDEARAGWQTLKTQYPDVFTMPTDDLLAWHLKEDKGSVAEKHRHAALIAANFDCRDRPTEPHPFVARGRLFAVLGEFDKAAADFATASRLNGTGWVTSECRRLVRDASRALDYAYTERPHLEDAFKKLKLAATYLEQDPKTMAPLLLGTPPAHRVALANAKLRLGLPLDEQDRNTLASLIRLPKW